MERGALRRRRARSPARTGSIVAVALGAFLLVGSPAAATPAVDEGVVANVPCPDVGAEPSTGRTVRLDENGGTLECVYILEGTNINHITITWSNLGSGLVNNCDVRDGTGDIAGETSSNSLFSLGRGDASARATISFTRADAPEPLSAWQAAANTLLDAIEPLSEPCAPAVPCALSVGDLVLDEQTTFGLTFGLLDTTARLTTCHFDPPEGVEGLPSADVSVTYAAPSSTEPAKITQCIAEDEVFAGGRHLDGPGDLAIRARIFVRGVDKPYDDEALQQEARRLMDAFADKAASCADVPVPELYTPLPAWLADHLDESFATGRPTMQFAPGGAATPLVTVTGATPSDTIPADPVPPTSQADIPTTDPVASSEAKTNPLPTRRPSAVAGRVDSGFPPGWLLALMRIFAWIALPLSVLGVAIALFTLRKESRVRPRMDMIRIAVMAVTAIVTTLILGRSTAPWIIGTAIVAGAALGLLQGRNVEVRLVEQRVMARRSRWAIVAFLAGLILSQLSGLLGRLGILSIGIGLTLLSASLAAGIAIGRQPKVREARASMAAAAIVAVLVLPIAAAVAGQGRAADASPGEHLASPPATTIPPPAHPPPTDTEALLDSMVDWTTLRLHAGYAKNLSKLPVEISLPVGFSTIPEPITVVAEWDRPLLDQFIAYSLEETYTFVALENGVCCEVLYAASGTETRTGQAAIPIIAEASLGPMLPVDSSSFHPEPFGDKETLLDDSCGRRLLGSKTFDSTDYTFTTLTVGDNDSSGREAPPIDVYADCDLPGFTPEAAIARAPEPPPPGDPARFGSSFRPTGVACPVYQEVYSTINDTERFRGEGSTADVVKLFRAPNEPACSGVANPGDERKGGVRNEFQYDLVTLNETIEGSRQQDAADDFDSRRMPWQIEDAQQCAVGPDGIPVEANAEQGSCLNRTFHRFGDGRITIWTDTSTSDGPDTIIRGEFPWGHYVYNCHHCEVGDPHIAEVLDAWHQFAHDWNTTGMIPDFGEFGQEVDEEDVPVTVATTVGDDTSGDLVEPDAELVDADATPDEVTDPAAVDGESSDDDVSAEEAAAVALVSLLGAMGVAATTISESGRSASELLDAYRDGGLDGVGNLLGTDIDMPESPDDRVRGWDPNQERFRDMSRAERARLEEVDYQQRRGERLERYDRERAENRRPREELEALIAEMDRRDELEAALWAAQDESARWADPAYLERVINDDAYDGMLRDIEGLPGEARELGRAINEVLNDPATWEILEDTVWDTAYDAAGAISPVEFGNARRNAAETGRQLGRLGAALGQAFAADPVGFVFEMSPLADVRDSMDPDRTLGQRLGSLGAVLGELFPAMGGASAARDASNLAEAARELDRVVEAADSARAVDRISDTAEARRDIERAREAAARARDVDRVGDTADAIRSTDRASEAASDGAGAARDLERTGDRLTEGAADGAGAVRDADRAEALHDALDEIDAAPPKPGGVGNRVEDQINRNRQRLGDDLGSAEDQLRREAWEANRRAGAEAVDDFADEVAASPNLDAELSPEAKARRREAALRLQTNKQGLDEIKKQPLEVQAAFNNELRAIYTETDAEVLMWAQDYVNDQRSGRLAGVEIQGNLRFEGVENGRRVFVDDVGNRIELFEPTNTRPGTISVGADRDFTVYVRPADRPTSFSLPRDEVRPVYNQAFYDAMGGDAMRERLGIPEVTPAEIIADAERRGVPIPDDMDKATRQATIDRVAERLDQAVTDDLDPEAYTRVDSVINRPFGELGDTQQVGLTITHKHEEWQWRADHSTDRTVTFEGADNAAGGGVEWASLSEDQRAEGIRQIVKQNGNQIQPRLDALQRQTQHLIDTGKLPPGTPLPKPDERLDRALEIMASVKNDGIAPVDMERQLRQATGMTPSDVAHAAGERIRLMEQMRPPEVRDLQRQMDSIADRIVAELDGRPLPEGRTLEAEVWDRLLLGDGR